MGHRIAAIGVAQPLVFQASAKASSESLRAYKPPTGRALRKVRLFHAAPRHASRGVEQDVVAEEPASPLPHAAPPNLGERSVWLWIADEQGHEQPLHALDDLSARERVLDARGLSAQEGCW